MSRPGWRLYSLVRHCSNELSGSAWARPSAPAHRCCVSCSTSLPLLGVFLCVAATRCEGVLSNPCVPFNVIAVESYSGLIYVLSCLAFETGENERLHLESR